MIVGPDARRYLYLAEGVRVPRPFCWRFGLPAVCGTVQWRWWAAWAASWPVLVVGMISLARTAGTAWPVALAAAALLAGLPGVLGPQVTIPVGVDLPATALALAGAAGVAEGSASSLAASAVLICTAAACKETTPIWAALWCWSPLPLLALAVPAARAAWVHWRGLEATDPLGAEFQAIADHPVRSALAAHRARWRDAHLHLAPWGVCLVALLSTDWRLAVVVAAAAAQLLVATDTVRIVQCAAGPAVALAAAEAIPHRLLLPAAVVHFFWWYRVERV